MNTELSPKGRTIVSGVTAVAITAVLVSTLVESLNPALLFNDGENIAPQTIAFASMRFDAASISEA